MVEKNIKDYLHLYMGCKFVLTDDDGIDRQFHLTAYNYNYYRDWHSELKPILRPLSDMSEDEAAHIDDLARRQLDGIETPANTKFVTGIRTNTAEALRWCLSKRFDVFGLIAAGLAIDITKQPQQ